MLYVAPRSTWSHCGSLNRLDQRVVRLPSTAKLAVVPAFSADEAVAVLFKATFAVVQPPEPVGLGMGVFVGGPNGVLVGVLVRVAVAGTDVLVGVFVAALDPAKTWNSQIE